MTTASAIKTKKGYVPLLKGKLRGSDSHGPQKTQRLQGVYSKREWAVQKAQDHIDREAAARTEWDKKIARNK